MIELSDKINNKRRPRFISRNGLLLILATVVVISWLVYPRSLFFERDNGEKVSRLSLSYLKVLLAKAENDIDIRLRLADQQMRFWQVDNAWQTITPLLSANISRADYLALRIRFKQLVNAEQLTNQEHELHQNVVSLLSKVLATEFADAEIASIAAAMGQHYQAGKLFEKLARMQNNSDFLHLAGAQYLAGQKPDLAAQVYYRLYQRAPSLDTLFLWAKAALAHKVSPSQLQWFLNARPSQPSLTYWRLAGHLALAASSFSDYLLAQEKIYALSATEQDREQLVKAYMGQGELTKALPLVKQQLADKDNDLMLRRRIRDLYLWLGDHPAYLEQVKWLATHSPRPEELAQAAPLAIGSFLFEDATWLYARLSEFRPLTKSELTNWFESHYQAGTAEEGGSALRGYMDQYGPSAHLVAMLARVAHDLGDYQQLLSDWTFYGRKFQLPPSTYELYSGALWKEGDFIEALQVLDNVPNNERSAAYWKLYGDLAWLGEQADKAIVAYQNHLRLVPEAEGESVARLEVLLTRYQPNAYFELMVSQFKRHGLPRYLLLASDILIQRGDVAQLDELIQLGEQKGALDALPVLRTYQSWVFQQQGKHKEAIAALQKANSASPDNLNIQLVLLWALLAHGDQSALDLLVSDLNPRVVSNASFWQPMALSYERMKKRNQAIPWYQRLLKAQPDNYEMLFNYAEVLKSSGNPVASYRVKQTILTKLSEHVEQFGSLPPFLQLALRNEFQGIALTLNDPILYKTGNENLLLSYLVQANQQFAAQRYYQLFKSQNVDIQKSLELRFALANGDKNRLKALVAEEVDLPPADRMSALVLLDRDREAIHWAQEHFSDNLTVAEQSQVRQQLISLKPKYTHALHVSYDHSSAFQQDIFRVKYGLPFGEAQHWQTTLDINDFAPILLPAGDKINALQQIRWTNKWQWQNDRDNFSFSTDLSWGDGRRRDGIGFDWNRQWWKDLSTQTYWRINQHSTASQLATVLAQEDVLGMTTKWQLSSRETLALDIKTLRYESQHGDHLGNGNAINLFLSEQVFRSDPSINVYFNWQWQRNSIVASNFPKTTNALDGIVLAPTDIITPRYGRLSIGTRVFRGQPGNIGVDRPSPRLFLDANIGYLYFAGRTDFGISSGLGWRIAGSDELSVSAQYQSSNLQQNSDFKLNITYQIHFD